MDGFDSEEEFTATQLERFKMIDTDKVGEVSHEENKDAIKKMCKRLERFQSVRGEKVESWSEWQDLNLRPPRPERGALPDCATLRNLDI